MTPDPKPDLELADELLALPTRDQQTAFLRDAGLLNAEGLDRLLDEADRLLNDDPGKARKMAELCAGIVDQVDAPAAVPRASYILAEAYVVNGDFDTGLRLIKDAHDGYAALGMHLEALRTNVGKMVALLELGRYQEALNTGRIVLDALDCEGKPDMRPIPQETDLLTSLVQQNRGGCLEYMGRYEEALDAYAVAEKHYRDLGMIERLGEILDNRGFVLSYLGRGNEALASHEAAASIFDEAGLTLSHAMSLSNVGGTYLRLADYMSSLDAFEQARRLLGSLDANAEKYFRLRNTADAYLALNLYSEALTAYQEVDSLLEGTGMEQDRALTLWGTGSALMSQSELGRAEEMLIEAARLFAAAQNAPMLSGVMLEQASVQAIRGDTESALTTTRRALDLVSEDDWPVQQIYAHLRLADLLLPVVAEAEPHLLEARRLVDRVALPQLRYRLNERLGRLRRLQGRDEEAQALLEAAVSEIEHLRGTVTQETMRASFLQDKVAAYEDLLQLHLASDDGNAQRAFTVAERAKSRALADLIAGGVGKSSAASRDDEIEERLRVLQVDLNATYSRMLGGTEDGQDVPVAGLQDRAAGIESEISRLRLQAGATSADPFAASVSPEGILERLPLDATLLAYHIVEDEV
nr:tetratricopeptide repeat protein [Actinomycetota bacterium]